ncbi:MAG TPA: class I SAM-dependent methyltransferase [Chthoniobacteraceae bacterium]|jgi:ubiquinone/menaquinone biosynthesis C-methylase UbiE|nr:class I SAM-dependent methyltransferase [Chthoniobacteraceae bacterium]
MGRFEGILSRAYDLVAPAVLGYHAFEDKLAERVATEYVTPLILDFGVGTGITARALLERNPGCRVLGVDNEAEMIHQALSNLGAEVAMGTVEVHYEDGLEYLSGLADGSIDVVASAFTLHNCLRQYGHAVEEEFFRILRPGGLFINVDKYAADDGREYVRELTEQILRYDVLKESGGEELRRAWIAHEIEDQMPERIMWARSSLERLGAIGFHDVTLSQRLAQYAIVAGYKS